MTNLQFTPPFTRQEIVRETLHGIEIADPYRWLEDQESPETRAWIAAQMAHTKSLLDPLPGREKIKQRLTELLKIDAVGIPQERRGVYFLMKRAADQDQYVLYRRVGLEGLSEEGRNRLTEKERDFRLRYTVLVALKDVAAAKR